MFDVSTTDVLAILPYIAAGFAAQIIDGALGMAFGLISSTLLVSFLGVTPAVASASVHTVESFTTAASGASHIAHRNVDWRLFRRLVLPGVVGGVLGAYVLSSVDAAVARPFVMAYLSAIGLYLLYRGWRGEVTPRKPRIVEPLGLVGGFLDAAGGGGWGPVVTSNLLGDYPPWTCRSKSGRGHPVKRLAIESDQGGDSNGCVARKPMTSLSGSVQPLFSFLAGVSVWSLLLLKPTHGSKIGVKGNSTCGGQS